MGQLLKFQIPNGHDAGLKTGPRSGATGWKIISQVLTFVKSLIYFCDEFCTEIKIMQRNCSVITRAILKKRQAVYFCEC